MRQLPRHLLKDAYHYGRLQKYQKDQSIFLRGDAKPGLSIIVSGVVKVGNFDLEGRYQLTALLKTGDTFGEFTLFTQLPRTHNSNAFTDCEILLMNQSQFNRWSSDNPEITPYMLTNISQKLHTALELLDDIKRLPVHVRLAKIILTLCTEQESCKLDLRQSDYAEFLGLTVLSTHKAIKKLNQMKLIQSYYGGVKVGNPQQLKNFVSEKSSLLPIEFNE